MTVLVQKGTEIVPGYTLVRRLGSGMAGEVWVARASGGVYVAIKLIRDLNLIGSKRELGALRIVREVKHTNLCPLIGVWFFDNQGEILNSSDTDAILGRESSLIDTECLTSSSDIVSSDSSSETQAFGVDSDVRRVDDDNTVADPTTTSTPDNFDLLQQSDLESGYQITGPMSAVGGISGGSDLQQDNFGSEQELPPASEMVVAMGLGEKTLHDRLTEMRAPDNQPDPDDPLQLPGGLPVPELLRYITGSASAIDELNLHHSIYHCDIKPQNILIVGGQAQVCDFGLARQVQDSRKTQLAIGTPAYGAPEMLFDQTYSKTIDQYSLAVTYYELRTSQLPFETTRRSSFLRSKASGELDMSLVPANEERVLRRATMLDPNERFDTCEQFVEALTEAVYGTNETAAPDNSLGKLGIVVAALLLIAISSAAFLLQSQRNLFPWSVAASEKQSDPSEHLENDTIATPEQAEPDFKPKTTTESDMMSEASVTTESTLDTPVPPAPKEATYEPFKLELDPSANWTTRFDMVRNAAQTYTDQNDRPKTTADMMQFINALVSLSPSLTTSGQVTWDSLEPNDGTPNEAAATKLARLWGECESTLFGEKDWPEAKKESQSWRATAALHQLLCRLHRSQNETSTEATSQLAESAGRVRRLIDDTSVSDTPKWNEDASFTLLLSSLQGLPDSEERIWQDLERTAQTPLADPERQLVVARSLAEQITKAAIKVKWNSNSPDVPISLKNMSNLLGSVIGTSGTRSGLSLLQNTRDDKPLASLAELAAGLVAWQENSLQRSLQHWLSHVNSKPTVTKESESLRHAASTKLIPWLIETSGTTDQQVKTVRYQKRLQSTKIVLDLASNLATGNALLEQQLERELFLHAVARRDDSDAIERLPTIRSIDAKDLSPQLGKALIELSRRRDDQQATKASQIERLNDWALGLTLVDIESTSPVDPSTKQTHYRDHLQPTIKLARTVSENGLGQLPKLPDSADSERIAKVCEQYLAVATDSTGSWPKSRFDGDIMNWLNEIEFASALAADLVTEKEDQANQYLIAFEAFLQQRYEQADDKPASELISQLELYANAVTRQGENAVGRYIQGKLYDQQGFQARSKSDAMQKYAAAKNAYDATINQSSHPPDLHGDAYRSRAALLGRMAALSTGSEQLRLLNQSILDAQKAIDLPARWHLDNDERFATAAESNLAMVRLMHKRSAVEKSVSLDQAEKNLQQAILERKQLELPSTHYLILQLNGYWLDMLANREENRDRYSQKMKLARQLIQENSTRRVDAKYATLQKLTHTIVSPSTRLRCHWHSMCAMIHAVSQEPQLAADHLTYAHAIASESLPETDDRRHLATLGLIQIRSVPLVTSHARKQPLDPDLVAELRGLLNEIKQPLPNFKSTKEQYQQELDRISR